MMAEALRLFFHQNNFNRAATLLRRESIGEDGGGMRRWEGYGRERRTLHEHYSVSEP